MPHIVYLQFRCVYERVRTCWQRHNAFHLREITRTVSVLMWTVSVRSYKQTTGCARRQSLLVRVQNVRRVRAKESDGEK